MSKPRTPASCHGRSSDSDSDNEASMQSCVSLKKTAGTLESQLSHLAIDLPMILPSGTCEPKSSIFGLCQEGSQRWARPLLSSPSHLIMRSSLIQGCQVTFAIGACSIMTAFSTFDAMSQIQIVVGMIS